MSLLQNGALSGNPQRLDDNKDDDSGHADLDEVTGDGGHGGDPVAIDETLRDIIAHDLDDAGQDQGQDVPEEGLLFLRDSPHGPAHEAHDDQGEGGPQGPAGEKVKQGHAHTAGDHAGAFAEEDGGNEQGDVAQVDQSAVGRDGQANVDGPGEDEDQHQAHGGKGNVLGGHFG